MSHDAHDALNRRRFLKGSLLFGGSSSLGHLPVIALCEAIVNSFVQRAAAETANASVLPRNYINVLFAGAPNRFAFDGWTRVNGDDAALQPNAMVATRLKANGGVYNEAIYETFGVNGGAGEVLVPHFFKHSVQTSAGNIPLTNLLKNMLVIRGYGTGIDGHPANAAIQLMPLPGTSSLAGTVADNSLLPFSAVQFPNRGNYTQFASEKGKGLLSISDANPLAKLMEAFGPPAAMKGRQLKLNLQTVVDAYSERLKKIADLGTPEAKVVGQNYRNAQEMMKKGVSGLLDYWTPTLASYKNLINGATNATGLAGLSDLPIVNNGNSDQFRFHDGPSGLGYKFATDYDVRSGHGGMFCDNLAEGFTLAEYMLKNNLGSSLELMATNLFNVNTRLQFAPDNVQNRNGHMPFDMHENGAVAMVVYTHAIFRGFSAAVLEFASRLSAVKTPTGNLWQDTVIHATGDFARIGRNNGSGSDHGFNQMNCSVYSGAIDQGPFVVGNVKPTGPYPGGFDGSQGVGGQIEGYIQKGMPTPLMMASTVTELLRVEQNPYSNSASPLVKMVNGKMAYSTFGTGKTVPR